MCCAPRNRQSDATGKTRSLLSLARTLTPPLEDRAVTIPRSDEYDSDDEHDFEMGGEFLSNDNGNNLHLDVALPAFPSASTFTSTYNTSSNDVRLNHLYNAIQVAATINEQGRSIDAVHISSLFVQIGTLHLEKDQVDNATSSFHTAVNILEQIGLTASGEDSADQTRRCVETTALKSLGHIFFKKCQYQRAMSYFLRAHCNNAHRAIDGSQREEILSDINTLLALARQHKERGEFRHALDALLAASVGVEVAFGRCHELFVQVLDVAASIFQSVGETDAAARLFKQVLITITQLPI